MKAIGYIRVSTEEQAQDGVSLDNQRDRIKTYCEQKGLKLLGVIEDTGSGGTNRIRPGFNALLDRLEHGDIDVLVLYSLERLSRDLLTLLTVKRMCDLLNIQIHTGDGEDGRITFLIKGVFAEMERWQIKERTRKAMAYKKRNGEVVGSVPYGYRRQGNELVVEEDEQKIAWKINLYHQSAMSLREISDMLKDEGITTRNGKPWHPEQIKRVIIDYNTTISRKKKRDLTVYRKILEEL